MEKLHPEARPAKKSRYSLTLDNGSAAPAAPPPPPSLGSSSDEEASGERTDPHGGSSPVVNLARTPGTHEAGPRQE